ncbi:MAG: DUF2520 domain-containing protein [Flavobacteriales bacterium]|nr:DUF2520 domain-containing protein [Flavobacteriales bacterium]
MSGRDLNDGVLLIGTGRVAFHLGHALTRAGRRITGIAGRDQQRTRELARELRTTPFAIDEGWPICAIYVIAVKDDAIAELAARIAPRDAVVAHTSGAQDVDVLKPHAHRAVLWPIQSLSPGTPADLTHTPFIIDGNDPVAREAIRDLAREVSGKVVELPLKERQVLHLAAVFASNFPVFLLQLADQLLDDHGIDPTLLRPLWSSIARKVAEVGPENALTGPARRGDLRTLERQLELSASDPDLRAAYALLSRMIMERYHPDTPWRPKAPDGKEL